MVVSNSLKVFRTKVIIDHWDGARDQVPNKEGKVGTVWFSMRVYQNKKGMHPGSKYELT